MRNIPLLLAVMLAMISAAGCVTPADNIVGTWTSDHFPESFGDYYKDIVTTFNADGTGTETWIYGNGSTYTWNISWTKNGNAGYVYAYDSWTSIMAEDGHTHTDSDGWVYVREEGNDNDGYVGTWTTLHAYEEDGINYTVVKEICSDNTGYSIWTADDGTVDGPWKLIWYPLNKNTYTNYYKDAVIYFTILENGTAVDNYDLTYIKS